MWQELNGSYNSPEEAPFPERLPRVLLAGLVAAAALAACKEPTTPATSGTDVAATGLDAERTVVQVAPPTGDTAKDRASIRAAIALAHPGDVIRFAAGTYVIGVNVPFSFDFIPVPVPRVTLVGHPDGTTLRGCDITPATQNGQCDGLALIGGHQTIRNITFEDFSNAGIILGELLTPSEPGGYRVEHNTFRNSFAGLGMFSQSSDVSRVENNDFINVAVPLSLFGKTVRFRRNRIVAPEPENIPVDQQPIGIIARGAGPDFFGGFPCENNVFERNYFEGMADGIIFDVFLDGECRQNVVRKNAFVGQKIFSELDGGTMVFFINEDGFFGGGSSSVDKNVVADNTLLGSEGVGIILFGASRTTIAHNSIRDVSFTPGFDPLFLGVNRSGVGVWVAEGSDANRIVGNRFRDTESCAVVLEGDRNLVATKDHEDVVLDLGMGNRVVGKGSVGSCEAVEPAPATAAPAGPRPMAARLRRFRGLDFWTPRPGPSRAAAARGRPR